MELDSVYVMGWSDRGIAAILLAAGMVTCTINIGDAE